MTEARRSALVLASYEYQDPKLRRLRAPARDAEELARVLSNPAVGDFEVEVSTNEPEHVVRRKLAAFFRDRGLDDLLLLHLSCHGLKDEDGHLYFATVDTEVANLDATAITSEFVNRQMTRSRSRRIVLLLDCCYSGAFAAGMLSRAGDRVDIKERFDGRGRVVLTASSAMEYSFEGDEVSGAPNASVFTSALVRGLETGAADRDRDGWISVDELYDYAFDEVRGVTPSQTPGKWTFDVQGELYLARSSIAPVEPVVELPVELQSAIESPFAHVRAGAVEELAALVRGSDTAVAGAARGALDGLTGDDSRRVSEAAERALGRATAPVAAAPAPPVMREPARAAVSPPRSALAGGALALVGAAAALFTCWITVDPPKDLPRYAEEFDDPDALLLYPRLEFIPVGLAVAAVGVALLLGRVRTSLAAGLLIGFGLLSAAAALGLRNFFEDTMRSSFVPVGALAILAAGLVCAWSIADDRGRVDKRAVWLGAAGAAICVVTIVSVLISYGIGNGGYTVEFWVALGAIPAAVLALGLVSRPILAAAITFAVGGQTALHFVGLIDVSTQSGTDASLLTGGIVGTLGALLVAAAGVYAYRSTRPPAAVAR